MSKNKIIEKERIYVHPYEHAPGYITQIVRNITHIEQTEEGHHRLRCKNGEERFIHNDFVKIYTTKGTE